MTLVANVPFSSPLSEACLNREYIPSYTGEVETCLPSTQVMVLRPPALPGGRFISSPDEEPSFNIGIARVPDITSFPAEETDSFNVSPSDNKFPLPTTDLLQLHSQPDSLFALPPNKSAPSPPGTRRNSDCYSEHKFKVMLIISRQMPQSLLSCP
ncbi:uncharacterized protein BDV17DRAFT_152202 [Aspergillus undulatus]|uniref:uncharacterized protein n=1 Tax=Aspergillus undulatus TaxID=1810928 RepID=UPI003CCD2BE4